MVILSFIWWKMSDSEVMQSYMLGLKIFFSPLRFFIVNV